MNWKSSVVCPGILRVIHLICISTFIFWNVDAGQVGSNVRLRLKVSPVDDPNCKVKLALVLCNENSTCIGTAFERQFNQTVTLLKSILITIEDCVHVILFSNRKSNYDKVASEIFGNPGMWNPRFTRRLNLEFVALKYPPGTAWMQRLFRPCATFPIFLPEVLKRHDAIIYVDTDFIFLRSVNDLWEEMKKFSPTALAGIVLALGKPKNGHVPFYGPAGINSGIILMNLTRMRATKLSRKLVSIGRQYKTKLIFGDQDILNIHFYNNPEEMHNLTCDWNYVPKNCYCHRKNSCKAAVTCGISALHGNGVQFSFMRESYEPFFRSIFLTFMNTRLDSKFDLRKFIYGFKTENGNVISSCNKEPQFKRSVVRRLEDKLRRNSRNVRFN